MPFIDFFSKPYLDRHFRDPQLKALLASAWGTYGLPPSQSAFYIHALVMSSFLKGGWYPVGGAQEIANQILPVIKQAGGKAIAQRQVTEIIVENGMAIGVRARKSWSMRTIVALPPGGSSPGENAMPITTRSKIGSRTTSSILSIAAIRDSKRRSSTASCLPR